MARDAIVAQLKATPRDELSWMALRDYYEEGSDLYETMHAVVAENNLPTAIALLNSLNDTDGLRQPLQVRINDMMTEIAHDFMDANPATFARVIAVTDRGEIVQMAANNLAHMPEWFSENGVTNLFAQGTPSPSQNNQPFEQFVSHIAQQDADRLRIIDFSHCNAADEGIAVGLVSQKRYPNALSLDIGPLTGGCSVGSILAARPSNPKFPQVTEMSCEDMDHFMELANISRITPRHSFPKLETINSQPVNTLFPLGPHAAAAVASMGGGANLPDH